MTVFDPWVIDDTEISQPVYGPPMSEPRVAEFDESKVSRDEKGQFSSGGGGGDGADETTATADRAPETPAAKLRREAAEGVAAVSALLDRAVQEANYGAVDDAEEEIGESSKWDDVDVSEQSSAFYKFMEDKSDDMYGDVDSSSIDEDVINDLRKDVDEEIAAEAEADTLVELTHAFPRLEPTLPLGDADSFALYRKLDPATIIYGEDDGEGAPLEDTDKLAFMDGTLLTPDEIAVVEQAWNKHYEDVFEVAKQKAFESDSYYEQHQELVDQAVQEAWNNLTDDEKFEYVDDDVKSSVKAAHPPPDPDAPHVAPTQWPIGIAAVDGDVPSSHVREVARTLVELRAQEIATSRGIGHVGVFGEGDFEQMGKEVWNSWKGDSQGHRAKQFQYATALELGGVDRFSDEERNRIEATLSPDQLGSMKAYARAQWETTQFLMEKAGQDHVEVYRAIYLSEGVVDAARKERITTSEQTPVSDRPGVSLSEAFTRLPDLDVKRASLQSATADRGVANRWRGPGYIPPESTRVVLRIRAPRTSVMSLPVFGQNVHSEQEVVLVGAKEPWTWDAYHEAAPEFERVPLGDSRTTTVKASAKKIVVDLDKIDRELGEHWLKSAKKDRAIEKVREKARQRHRKLSPKEKKVHG